MLAWNPNGKMLATSDGSSVVLWDAASGRRRGALDDSGDSLTALAWSPDGGTLSGRLQDETVILWDAATGQRRATLSSFHDPERSGGHGIELMSWSPDGSTLTAACRREP
jgi:WD40 repeat protein